MKRLSELKTLGKFCKGERELIGDLLVELELAEPDKKEEPKYKVGDVWRFDTPARKGRIRIEKIRDNSADNPWIFGKIVHDIDSGDRYDDSSFYASYLTELLWRDPS